MIRSTLASKNAEAAFRNPSVETFFIIIDLRIKDKFTEIMSVI